MTTKDGPSRLSGVLGVVERLGNKLPNPFLLFVGLLLLIAVASTIVAAFHVTVTVPGVKESVPVRAALAPDGLVALMDGAIDNFVTFPALGPVLVVVLGVGVAQGTGALEAAVRLVFARVPRSAVPYVVALVACQGHVMSDASFLVIPPLAALVFLAVGRHPLAGLIGAYACTATGYGGGLLMGTLDASLAGITQKAASLLPAGQDFQGNIAMNYYFGVAAGLILPIVGGLLIDKVLEPRLGPWRGEPAEAGGVRVSREEKRAVLVAAGAVAVFGVLLTIAWLLPGSPLQGEGGTLVPSPLLSNLVIAISVSFLIFGLVYARVLPVERDKREVGKLMEQSIRDMAGFIVLIFIVSQTLAVLAYSNLGVLMAVKLADAAEGVGLARLRRPGVPGRAVGDAEPRHHLRQWPVVAGVDGDGARADAARPVAGDDPGGPPDRRLGDAGDLADAHLPVPGADDGAAVRAEPEARHAGGTVAAVRARRSPSSGSASSRCSTSSDSPPGPGQSVFLP